MDKQLIIDNFERQVKFNLSGIDSVLLGLSGGADSMALMYALHRLGISFTAIHCNFHLRGDESNRDQRFVEDCCSRLGIDLIVEQFDVYRYMSDNDASLEMACRELRYKRFREIISQRGLSRIATAHHSDDNIETMLLNMLRGCGLAGLKGMSIDTGEIARPLLSFSKRQILDYIDAIGATYVIDSTNLHSDVRRNFIRNEVLPLLESRWEGARKALYATQENINRAYRIYDAYINETVPKDSRRISRVTIKNSPDALSLVHHFASRFGANRSIEEEMTVAVCGEKFGQQWFTDCGVFYLSADSLMFFDDKNVKFSFGYRAISRELISDKEIHDCPSDRAYLPLPLAEYRFRTSRSGERFKPINMKGSKSVSDIFKEAKVPLPLRAGYPVMVNKADEIVWIPGVKRSRIDLIEPDTISIYEVYIDS